MGLAASGGAPGPTPACGIVWRMPSRADRPSDGVPWWQTPLGLRRCPGPRARGRGAARRARSRTRVSGALSDVGRDADGTDPWTDPIGLEPVKGGFLVGRIPDCAAAPITRISRLGPGQQADLGRDRAAHGVARVHRGGRAERLPGGHPLREAGRRHPRPARREPAADGRRRRPVRGRRPRSGQGHHLLRGRLPHVQPERLPGGRRVQGGRAAAPTSCPTASAATTTPADAWRLAGLAQSWLRPRSTTPWRRRSTSAASMPLPCHALATRASTRHASPPVTSAPSA